MLESLPGSPSLASLLGLGLAEVCEHASRRARDDIETQSWAETNDSTDYPMTSSITAEYNPMGSRAKLVLTVFSCIGLGVLTCSITYLILLVAFERAMFDDTHHLQWVWRLLFGIGLFPPILTLHARFKMAESVPYKKYVVAGRDRRGLRDQIRDFREYFTDRNHLLSLFAVCASWFLLYAEPAAGWACHC